VVLAVVTAGYVAFLARPEQLAAASFLELAIWTAVVAAVELWPVPGWRGLRISMGFPVLMTVAFLHPPLAAGAVALVGSLDPRELRREIAMLTALFNRAQVALAVATASALFHTVAHIRISPALEQVGTATLAAVAAYAVNVALVSVWASLKYRTGIVRVVRELRIGSLPEFLVSYLALALLGLVMAKFFLAMGFWSIPAFLLPLMFARQMFFRSRALEEAHKELQEREQVLQTLSVRMAEERQDERLQIAAYLHDDLAQLLFRLSIQVDVARRHLAAGRLEDAAKILDQIKDTKQQTSDKIRALIRDLHRSPLGPAGLAEAIHGFIAEVGADSDVRFHTDISEVELPPPIALLVYHIAREGVMNALKHAEASNVWVTVQRTEDAVELVLRDDGKGFDPEAPPPEGHFGLAMMRERAQVGGGTLDIRSAPGEGTTITVRFPTALLREVATRSPEGGADGRPGASGEAGASRGTHVDGPAREQPPRSARA
jgi:signal transduction histidine kinase